MSVSTAQKLRIKDGQHLLAINAPASFKKNLGVLPPGVKIITIEKDYNQLHWFVTSKAQMEKELKKILPLIKENIICWIYYPKGTAGIQTDLTRDKGWDALLAHSDKLTWISLIAFDETWSAFGCRLSTEADKKKAAQSKDRPVLQYIDAATKTVRLPEDLATAFNKNKTAADFFNTLSFTNRKEYVEWVVSAKREETRTERVKGTIELLVKGWKNPQNN